MGSVERGRESGKESGGKAAKAGEKCKWSEIRGAIPAAAAIARTRGPSHYPNYKFLGRESSFLASSNSE